MKDLSAVLIIVAFLFFIAAIVGLIKPSLVKQKTRLKAFSINAGLVFVLFISAAFIQRGAENKKPVATQQIQPIKEKVYDVITLTDDNINDFIVQLSSDYLNNMMPLVNKYDAYTHYKGSTGSTAFYNWRQQGWDTSVQERREYYRRVLNKNRKYLWKDDLNSLFTLMADLQLASIQLTFELRHKNGKGNKTAKRILKEGANKIKHFIGKYDLTERLDAAWLSNQAGD